MHDLRSVLTVDPDSHAVAERAARLVADAAREALVARGRFTLALTGGSSPIELYDLLASDAYRDAIDWLRTELFWGDERAVPPDDANSNYGSARAHLVSRVPVPAANVHRMEGERHGDLERAAEDYARAVRRVAGEAKYPALDVVLLGVGGDGHILSMYPGCPQIANPTDAVVALRNPPMNPAIDRISFTPPMLESARRVVVLAFGAGKAKALARALDPSESPEQLPAKLVARTAGSLAILADRAAMP